MPAPDFDDLAGKPGPAAKLLSCIVALHDRRTVKRHGVAWSPELRARLLQDARLSVDQYHRALRSLRQKRLVDVRMGYYKSVRMPHFALMPTLALKLAEPPVQLAAFQGGDITTMEEASPTLETATVQLIALQGGDIATYQRACATFNNHQKDEVQVEKEIQEQGVLSHALPEVESMKPVPGKKMTVAEVFAATKAKAAVELKGPLPLRIVWRTAYQEAFGGFVPGLTTKEQGQLRHFAKTCAPHEAEAVLEHAIAHWSDLTAKAKADAGAFGLPDKPQVAFLVKHLASAVNLWLEATPAKPVPVQSTAPKMPAVGMTVSKPQKVEIGGPKMTLAELMKSVENG